MKVYTEYADAADLFDNFKWWSGASDVMSELLYVIVKYNTEDNPLGKELEADIVRFLDYICGDEESIDETTINDAVWFELEDFLRKEGWDLKSYEKVEEDD